MRTERKKTCSNCKTEFSCYTENCWCKELPKIMPLQEGGDCFCEECLKKKIEEKQARPFDCAQGDTSSKKIN